MSQVTSSVPPVDAAQVLRRLNSFSRFLIRRRILLTGVLFALIIVGDILFGPKPHDVTNYRDPLTVIGVGMVVAGLAMRSWAAGILRKDTELATTGPYGLIRNPLYVGSFLMMFGFCALIGDSVNLFIVLGPVLLIYIVKVRQEEMLLAAVFPQQWPTYSRTTPRFVPRLAWPKLSSDWRITQWLNAREYEAVLATMAAMVAIKVWFLL